MGGRNGAQPGADLRFAGLALGGPFTSTAITLGLTRASLSTCLRAFSPGTRARLAISRAQYPILDTRPGETPYGEKSVNPGDQSELDLDDGVEIPDGRRWVKIYEPRPGQFHSKLEQAIFNDLIIRAQWRTGRVRFRGQPFTLARGQVLVVVTALADEWGVSHKAMRTILERLRARERLSMGKARGKAATLISITNYGTYQGRVRPKGKAPGIQGATLGQTEQESIESKNQPTDAPSDASATDDYDLSTCFSTAQEVLGNERTASQFVTRAHRSGMSCDDILSLLRSADKARSPIAYCYGALGNYRAAEKNQGRWQSNGAASKLDRTTSAEGLRPIGGSKVFLGGRWRPAGDISKTPDELAREDLEERRR